MVYLLTNEMTIGKSSTYRHFFLYENTIYASQYAYHKYHSFDIYEIYAFYVNGNIIENKAFVNEIIEKERLPHIELPSTLNTYQMHFISHIIKKLDIHINKIIYNNI